MVHLFVSKKEVLISQRIYFVIKFNMGRMMERALKTTRLRPWLLFKLKISYKRLKLSRNIKKLIIILEEFSDRIDKVGFVI